MLFFIFPVRVTASVVAEFKLNVPHNLILLGLNVCSNDYICSWKGVQYCSWYTVSTGTNYDERSRMYWSLFIKEYLRCTIIHRAFFNWKNSFINRAPNERETGYPEQFREWAKYPPNSRRMECYMERSQLGVPCKNSLDAQHLRTQQCKHTKNFSEWMQDEMLRTWSHTCVGIHSIN